MFFRRCSPIGEGAIEAAVDLVVHDARDADPAGLRDPLQPRGDVDAVAVNVAIFEDHVTRVDADAELDAPSSAVESLRAAVPRCTVTAQATASTTFGNSIRIPSPVVFTMRPLC